MKYVIKRDGKLEEFHYPKIIDAIESAFFDVDGFVTSDASDLAKEIAVFIQNVDYELPDQYPEDKISVESIQDLVEDKLMESDRKDVARSYVRYRYKHEIVRRENTTDKSIMELLLGTNEYWNEENANKNAKVVHTQRDYIAGITSTDITRRMLLSEDIVKAHDEGIIHFHDADYFAQNVLHNCELANLNDMLQNGTMINNVKIDKPHRLLTATTIATQLISSIGSSSYGGCTITLSHLAPFVRLSKEQYERRFTKIFEDDESLTQSQKETTIAKLVSESLRKEVCDSVQTFNYQVNSMTTTNGQAVFLSVAMYLGETDEFKEELAMLIEEFLHQRILGFKNEKGVYVTPAFPKLLYILEEDNIRPTSKYWYLTELAARCTAKRMVPDYISKKVMKELKKGDVYPCMGAVTGLSRIRWRYFNKDLKAHDFETTFEEFWQRALDMLTVRQQPGRVLDLYLDAEADDVLIEIKDTERNFVPVRKITRIITHDWVKITTSNGLILQCTLDHPLPVFSSNGDSRAQARTRTRTEAKNVKVGDILLTNTGFAKVDTVEPISLKGNGEYAYDVETASDHFEVNNILSNNCRSFLTPDRLHKNISRALDYGEPIGHSHNIEPEAKEQTQEEQETESELAKSEAKEQTHPISKYYGRFNQGVVTISLPDVAFSAVETIIGPIQDAFSINEWKETLEKLVNNDELLKSFWQILDERLELCHKALRIRHDRLSHGNSSMAPILWQYGALARLDKGESIKPLLYDGYSTISLGYAGLYECVKAITGESHTQPKGKEFGLSVMQHLNDMANKWKAEENIDYSVYGTPIESTTYKFAKSLKRRFGKNIFKQLDGNDRWYITNSYHIPVFEHIDPFEKLAKEAEFQKLSPGGAISYIECADLTKNIDAVIQVIQFIYDNIMYAELNTKSDYCMNCGYDGELKIIDKDNRLEWECPNCGTQDRSKLSVVRRVCGYLSSNVFNQGRTNDIRDRYVHLDDHIEEHDEESE